jgi:hypothetical protein
MDKPKRNNDMFLRGRTVTFTILWTASYLVACLISFFLVSIVGAIVPIWFRPWIPRYPVLLISLMMTLPALLHVQIIERVFKQSMRGWLLYSLLGAMLTTLLLLGLNPGSGWSLTSILYDAPIYFLGGTFVQTAWLWQRVTSTRRLPLFGGQALGFAPDQKLPLKAAWLWPIVGVLSLIASFKHPFLLRLMPGTESYFVLWLAIYSLGQGAVMHYLLSRHQDTEKAKVDFATDEDSYHDYVHLERLQEADSSTPLWDTGNDQALQNEA